MNKTKLAPPDPTLVVLAAGIGSRYGGLKQMDPVGPAGEFVVDYSVYDALRAGFGRVVFVIRRDIEDAFKDTLGSRIAAHAPVAYVFQELGDLPDGFTPPAGRKKPWGTAHAVLTARDAVDAPFAVINADDFYGLPSYEVLAAYLRDTAVRGHDYAMVGFVLWNTLSDFGSVARGICRADLDGNLESVTERTHIEKAGDKVLCADEALSGDETASMNMWGFKTTMFRHLEERFAAFLAGSATDEKAECFIPTVVSELVRAGRVRVKVLRTPAQWFGMTHPDDRDIVVARIRALVDAGEYPPDLWAD